MSSSTLFREARFVAGEGRMIGGVAIPYDTDLAGEIREKFMPGCFARSIKQRGNKVQLLGGELRGRASVIGRALEFREESEGLYAVFEVEDGPAGDVVLERANRGGVDVVVGYRPIGDRRDGGVLVRSEVALQDVRVAPVAAVSDEGSRTAGRVLSRSVARRRLEILELGRFRC